MSKKRIGILTSGGDCPGLNAVIRGAVKACNQLDYDCVGFLKGYEGLYDPVQYVQLTADSTRGILNQGGTILGSTNKGRFAATVGVQDRQELDPKLVEGVKQTINQLGIDGLICVGGDGSLAVAQQFHENGIPVVGVPKTIDNDLSATAFTFGFDSAIECATDALDRLHTTAASHERIMVLEVMGRHAGWIALHAGIAGGGDVILIPEVDWSYEHVCHKILHRESQGKKFTLVVVAEGAQLPGGELVGEQRDGAQMKLGGVGRAVADEIERRLHRETRLSVLGHLQRGGKPTTFDRVLATQFGAHAVRLVKEERFGEMICSQPPEMNSVPIMEAVNVLRQVDPHGPAVQAARALGISFGDRPADEIGQDIFDRLEPVAHVAGYEETVAEADSTEPTPAEATAEQPAVEVAVPEQTADEVTVAEETFAGEGTAEETTAEETLVSQPESETPAEAEEVSEATEEVASETTAEPDQSEELLSEEAEEAEQPSEELAEQEETEEAPQEAVVETEEVAEETAEPEQAEAEEFEAEDQSAEELAAEAEETTEEVAASEDAGSEEAVEDNSEEDVAPQEEAAEEPAEEWADLIEEEEEPAEAESATTEAETEAEPSDAEVTAEAETAAEQPTEEWADLADEEEAAAEQETAAEEPAEELAAEATAEQAAEEQATEEDAEVEAVAETMLDLVAEADEAIHGAPEELAEEASEESAEADEEPAAEETNSSEEATEELAAEEPEAEPTIESTLEEAATAEPEALEVDEEEQASVEADKPKIDLSEAQSALAATISAAAQASRDDTPDSETIGSDSDEANQIADMVKQKLAQAATAVSDESAEEPAPESDAEPAEAKAEQEIAARDESLAAPADEPHEEDLIAEARSALEEALAQ